MGNSPNLAFRSGAPGRPSPDKEADVSAELFKAVFRMHPAGVAIITAQGAEGPVGLTATSVFSISAEPALFAFSLSSRSPTCETVAASDTIVAHLLGVDELAAAHLFSSSGSDCFANTDSWSRLPTGEPYLPNAPIWVRGRIVERLKMQVGSATVIACHALEAHIAEQPHTPLIYHDRCWHAIDEHSRLRG